jgi:WD40 repeat protein
MRLHPLFPAALLVAGCGAPPAPVATLTVDRSPAPPPTAAPPSACDGAAKQRARVKGLLAEGRLDRALRVIAHADRRCPASAAESAADRSAARDELGRDPGAGAEALLEAGLAEKKAGRAPEAQRLFDRALAAFEREAKVTLDTPNGVSGEVHAVALGGQGQGLRLVVAHDNGVSVFDPETLAERFSFVPKGSPRAAAVSPEGRTALIGTFEHAALWDLETGQEVFHLDGMHDEVAFSADGKTFLVADTYRGHLEVWSTAARAALRAVDLPAPAKGAKGLRFAGVAMGGDTVAAGLSDGSVKLWSIKSGKELRSIAAHPERPRTVALSADGKLLAVAAKDQVQLWQVATSKSLHTWSVGFVRSLVFTRDGGELIAAGTRGLFGWSVKSGAEVRRIERGPHDRIALDPAGKRLVVAGAHDLAVRDASSGAELATLTRHAEPVRAVAWPAGSPYFALGSWDESVRVWDADKGAPLRTLKDKDSVTALSLSPDGKLLASGTTEPSFSLWDPLTGKLARSFPAARGWSSAATFSADGKLVAFGVDDEVSLADVATGKILRALVSPKEEVTALAFRADGAYLAVGTRSSKVRLFDVATGKQTAEHDAGNTISALVFSPDGEHLLVGENDLFVLDLRDGAVTGKREHAGQDGYVGGLAQSADGKLCAVGYSKGAVGWFELPSGALARKTRLHDDTINSMALRGRWLLTGSDDGSARLSDVAADRSVVLRAVTGTEDAYAFTPGPEARVELFGDAARLHLRCRVGRASYPFDLCEERFLHKGLVGAVLAGQDAHLVP